MQMIIVSIVKLLWFNVSVAYRRGTEQKVLGQVAAQNEL